jgi:hypothetical protein
MEVIMYYIRSESGAMAVFTTLDHVDGYDIFPVTSSKQFLALHDKDKAEKIAKRVSAIHGITFLVFEC